MGIFESSLNAPATRESVEWRGATYNVVGSKFGDTWLSIMYPDVQAQFLSAQHLAVVNCRLGADGKAIPYPPEVYAQIVAIDATIEVPIGEEKPQMEQIAMLFDKDTGLFMSLAAAAYIVLGVSSRDRHPTGEPEWSQVYLEVRKAQASLKRGDLERAGLHLTGAREIATTALRSYSQTAPESLDASDPEIPCDAVMEIISGESDAAGNSPQPDHS